MKKLLFSTILAATCVGGFSQIVLSKTLVGESDWMVRNVAADTPYCTLARKFQANAVLTLAKNAKGEGTVALDFQRNAFDVTRPYPVTLSVGGVSREYAVKPAVANVIILRVGNDAGLFQAMENNNILNVTIDSETFAMDLSGYNSAYSELQDCLGVQMPQASVAQATAPASGESSALSSQMAANQTDRIDTLLSENKRLTQELVKRDQQQKALLQQSGDAQSAEKEQLIKKLTESESKNAQLLAQIEKLEKDLQSSRQSLNPDMSTALAERDEQIARLAQQNQSLKKALDEAETRLASASSDSNENSIAMREKLAELETQASVFKAERDEYQKQLTASSSNSNQELNELRDRVAGLQSQIAEANAARDRYQNQLQTVSSSSTEEAESLNTQMAEMESQIAVLKAERDEYQKQLTATSSNSSQELNELRDRVAGLQSQIAEANAARDRYQNQLQTVSSSSTEEEKSLKTQLAEMESQITAYKAERDQYQTQLQKKTKEVADLQNREPEVVVKEVVKEVPAATPDFTAPDNEISARLAEAETEAQIYRAERDEYRRLLQQERARENVSENESANQNMIAELEKLQAEKAELSRQLAFAKSNAKASPSYNANAQIEIARLTDQLQEAQSKLANVEVSPPPSTEAANKNEPMLEARLKDMEAQLTTMTREKAELEDKLLMVQSAKENAPSSNDSNEAVMQARLSDMEDMVNRANKERDNLKAQLENTRSELNAKQKQSQEYDVVAARLQDMEDKVQRMAQEKAIIEGKLDAAQSTSVDGSREQEENMNALRARMGELQAQVANLNKEKTILREEMAAAKEAAKGEDSGTQEQLLQVTRRAQDMEQRLMNMTRENAQLQDEVQVAQQKAQEATKQLAQAAVSQLASPQAQKSRNELKTMQSEIASLEAQNAVLRQDVSQYKRTAQDQAKQAMVQQQEQAKAAQKQLLAENTLQRPRSYPIEGQAIAQNRGQPQPASQETSQKQVAVQQVQPQKQQLMALTGDEIKQVVNSAGVPLVSNIDRIDRVSGPDFAAFRWDTGVVYGSGEQTRLKNSASFEGAVQQYINKTKSRCTGSFDQTMTDRLISGVSVKVADIACVDANANGVAASILFFSHKGMFYALAHEADMNTFETAMDMRDRLANSIGAIF